ncbi:up-frameshift suppressor 3 family protein [Schizosaccharomyces osmophilus]|uniref:Up-frameshift suppressor 3 family protein n=1 Tax=Schizosaccharomyces osmophilus TaxID=2545709 RepID=A0AAF0AWC4_9SCHI|nr:up-frameshift suppressor 3 family protein [Schizosaccharomyces osmophilus]WBW74506.1 up-frameshift suppressor 3 family protein [Schizosaccharomyces osmophilus]
MVPPTSAKTRLPCKLLVHNLPDTLPEEIFLKSIASFHPFINWHRYHQGKRQNPPQPNIPSFAYLKFRSESHVHDFFRFYQGHVFVDKDEHVYRALLLVAPFQKVPPVKLKPDSLNGTIEDDPVFKTFVDKWNESLIPPPPPSPSHYTQNTSTPLLHYLAEKRGTTGTSPKPSKSKKEKKQRSKKSKLASSSSKQATPSDHSTGQNPSQSLEAKEPVKQDSVPSKPKSKKKAKPRKSTKVASSTSTTDSTPKPDESAKAVPKKISPKKKEASK